MTCTFDVTTSHSDAAAAAAGYTTHDVDYAQELHACPPYQDQLEYSEGHPFYIAHYSYNAGVLSHSSKTMKPLSDAEKAKGAGRGVS